jgi:GNAT superfamily N-acetyltransferase
MPTEFLIREATIADVPEILRHRRGMFEDMGYRDAAALEAMRAPSQAFLEKGIREGFFRGWLAETADGRIAGGGGIVITQWPAHPLDAQTRRATILNLYTVPAYRRQGIARALMTAMVDWCRREGFASVSLHASEDGRPLYESLGFEPTNEMRLKLK